MKRTLYQIASELRRLSDDVAVKREECLTIQRKNFGYINPAARQVEGKGFVMVNKRDHLRIGIVWN